MTALSGWGRFPVCESQTVAPRNSDAARLATQRAAGGIARGKGRSYGDAAVGTAMTIDMLGLDRMRAFDAAGGLLTLEAGVTLDDVIGTFYPRGFFPMVVPGTRFVSIGGAIAADIHGKNHHRDGGFGDHLQSLRLATASGDIVPCSRDANAELFAATIGGMGLTGTILEAEIALRPIETGWVRQKTIVAADLASAINALDQSDTAPYSVAWIDCAARGAALGRSLIFQGDHARLADLGPAESERRFPAIAESRLSVPFDCPTHSLNRWSVGAFNSLYYRLGARHSGGTRLVPAMNFFFPLDAIGSWNRIYGRQGFVQHHSVLPGDKAVAVLADMLDRIAARGGAAFLAVLKKLGPGGGLLSFPTPGYSLALDFPLVPGLLTFLEALDRRIIAAGGRLYLAKDARQSPATFEAGYPALPRFRQIRRSVDPGQRLRSRLADRLGI